MLFLITTVRTSKARTNTRLFLAVAVCICVLPAAHIPTPSSLISWIASRKKTLLHLFAWSRVRGRNINKFIRTYPDYSPCGLFPINTRNSTIRPASVNHRVRGLVPPSGKRFGDVLWEVNQIKPLLQHVSICCVYNHALITESVVFLVKCEPDIMWDLTFSRPSSGMRRHVDLLCGSSTFLRNVGSHDIYTAPNPRRHHSSWWDLFVSVRGLLGLRLRV